MESRMGQLESVSFDDSEVVETSVLNGDRTLHGVAEAIKSGKTKKICVLVGAGISCAAGIPDFRSPGTGIYYNLQQYNLPNPEAMFEIDFFKEHPDTFYNFLRVWHDGYNSFDRLYYQGNINQRIHITF